MRLRRHPDGRQRRRRAVARAWADLPLRAKGLVVIAIPLGCFVVAAALFTVTLAQDRQAQARVLHTVEVERQVSQLRILLQSGVTGYVLTGQERYLASYEANARSLPVALARLRELVSDNPGQRQRLRQVRLLAERRQRLLAELVASVRANSPPGSRLVLLERARLAAEELISKIEEMQRDEERALAGRQAAARRTRTLAFGAIGLSMVLGLAGGVAAMMLFTSGVTRRASTLQCNAARLADGLPLRPVPPGDDELGALGRGLDRAAMLLEEREQALREAKRTAEQANEAKSEYLSRMSHELRTPLNAILGFTQLLQMEDLTDEQQASLQHILSGAKHLLALINEVLDIAAIEAGRLPLSLEPVAVADVADETVSLIRPLADEHGILLASSAPRCGDHVLGDRQRLKQILLNLLSNAVKYNRVAGSVRLGCQRVAGRRLRIEVADTGPGIPADSLERLFVPFERLEGDHGAVEGSGLGLPLSKRLAEAMGGTLGLSSTPEQGSTFWVELPLTEAPAERDGRDRAPAAAAGNGREQGPEPPATELTVLYIEDNLSNLQLVERVLSRRPGIRLISAMRPQLGLDLAGEHHPDLLLLDLHLPDLPGEEVLRRLRTNPKTAAVPVVVLSADARPSLIKRLLDQGARAFLTKPLDVKELLALLDEVAAERQAATRSP
jgi:signal transduction histidine kinase/ActR/RegA family two-component response regulator